MYANAQFAIQFRQISFGRFKCAKLNSEVWQLSTLKYATNAYIMSAEPRSKNDSKSINSKRVPLTSQQPRTWRTHRFRYRIAKIDTTRYIDVSNDVFIVCEAFHRWMTAVSSENDQKISHCTTRLPNLHPRDLVNCSLYVEALIKFRMFTRNLEPSPQHSALVSCENSRLIEKHTQLYNVFSVFDATFLKIMSALDVSMKKSQAPPWQL